MSKRKVLIPGKLSDVGELIYALPRNALYRDQKYFNSDLIFSANYATDSLGNRIHPGHSGPAKTLVFGGSFVYGEGVEAELSIPGQLEQCSELAPVANLGVPGYGPGHFLAWVKKQKSVEWR